MFNKREESESDQAASHEPRTETRRATPSASSRASTGPAVIGASINVDGQLRGEEDLVIEGKVKGSVELKKNSVTIGAQGDVQADIYAHTIYVDGSMNGNLVASERVVIRKSARIKGSIVSPRVSLEDGAHFNGSIDMDAESEALAKAFPGAKKASAPAQASSGSSPSGGADKKPETPAGQGDRKAGGQALGR